MTQRSPRIFWGFGLSIYNSSIHRNKMEYFLPIDRGNDASWIEDDE